MTKRKRGGMSLGGLGQILELSWRWLSANSLHDAFEFISFIVIAHSILENALYSVEDVCERPDRLQGSVDSDPIGKISRFRIVDDSVRQNAGTNSRKLIYGFGDIVFMMEFK